MAEYQAQNESLGDIIGPLTSPEILLDQYKDADSPGFVPGIHYLSRKYHFRKVREMLLDLHLQGHNEADHERLRILNIAVHSKEQLLHLGYEEVAIETFHDLFVELIENLFSMSKEQLLESFQESGQSDYYTWFMRLLTAGAIRGQAERFLPFLSDDVTFHSSIANGGSEADISDAILKYCRQEVEPMGKECEQVDIIALSELLGVVISIEYLDGRAFDEGKGLSKVVFNETSNDASFSTSLDSVERRRIDYFIHHPVYLLYRPGHFDILYPI